MWRNQVKEKIGKSIEERTKHKMTNKTKARRISGRKRNTYRNVIVKHKECD